MTAEEAGLKTVCPDCKKDLTVIEVMFQSCNYCSWGSADEFDKEFDDDTED